MSRRLLFFSLCVVLALAGCSFAPERQGSAAEVHALTGAHTRVVWVQGDGTDPFALGSQLVLMGLDTDDGRGERVILGERGSYVKPLLTPRGEQIVYSTHPDLGDPSVHIVNFDGSGGGALIAASLSRSGSTRRTAASGSTSAATAGA